MKNLLLLRHAKSSWKDSDIEDHERPLNKRGKKDAPKMGRLLREEELLPDLIISSTAKRCRKTTEHVIHASGYRGETRFFNDVYEATGDELLSFLARVNSEASTLLLVGHNPGLEQLVESLVGAYQPLTTAALVHVALPIQIWSDLAGAVRGTLVQTWQPRSLPD